MVESPFNIFTKLVKFGAIIIAVPVPTTNLQKFKVSSSQLAG